MAGSAGGALLVGSVAEFVLTRPVDPRRFRLGIILVGLLAAFVGPLVRTTWNLASSDGTLASALRTIAERSTKPADFDKGNAFWIHRYEDRMKREVLIAPLPEGALVANPNPTPVGSAPLVPGPALVRAYRRASLGFEVWRCLYGSACFLTGIFFGVVGRGAKWGQARRSWTRGNAVVGVLFGVGWFGGLIASHEVRFLGWPRWSLTFVLLAGAISACVAKLRGAEPG